MDQLLLTFQGPEGFEVQHLLAELPVQAARPEQVVQQAAVRVELLVEPEPLGVR